jgi:hypothetical protein
MGSNMVQYVLQAGVIPVKQLHAANMQCEDALQSHAS